MARFHPAFGPGEDWNYKPRVLLNEALCPTFESGKGWNFGGNG